MRCAILAGVGTSTLASPGTTTRSLAPREHGAYGQLGVPLVAGLALGRPAFASIGFTIAAVSVFLAHEPLLVLLGQRGPKSRREDGPRASRRLGSLGAAAVVFGGAGFVLADPSARLSVLGPLLLGVIVAAFVFRKEEKTPLGEVFAAAALSGAGFPVALAGGVETGRAAIAWGVWTAAFSMSTLAVHAVIARAKKLGSSMLVATLVCTTAVALASLIGAKTGALPWAVPISLGPFFLLALAVCVFPVHTRHLRRVGWGLVGASMATLVLLVATLR